MSDRVLWAETGASAAVEQGLANVRVMIVGTPRSGTTLVQRLVIEECGLAGAPESHFFTLVPELLRRARARELAAVLEQYASAPQLAGCGLRVDQLLGTRLSRGGLYELFRSVMWQLAHGEPEVCEKTPGHLWWWKRLTRRDPGLKLVIVVRDPRAVVASLRAARFTDQGIALLAENWRVDTAMAARAARALGPDRCLLVRYEDVVASEDEIRGRLARFHRPGAQSERTVGQKSAVTVLPWERWKASAVRPISSSRVNAWERELRADEIFLIESVCRRGMGEHGYGRMTSGILARVRALVVSGPQRWRYRMAVAWHLRLQRRRPL